MLKSYFFIKILHNNFLNHLNKFAGNNLNLYIHISHERLKKVVMILGGGEQITKAINCKKPVHVH